jgi:hypothetical protein
MQDLCRTEQYPHRESSDVHPAKQQLLIIYRSLYNMAVQVSGMIGANSEKPLAFAPVIPAN